MKIFKSFVINYHQVDSKVLTKALEILFALKATILWYPMNTVLFSLKLGQRDYDNCIWSFSLGLWMYTLVIWKSVLAEFILTRDLVIHHLFFANLKITPKGVYNYYRKRKVWTYFTLIQNMIFTKKNKYLVISQRHNVTNKVMWESLMITNKQRMIEMIYTLIPKSMTYLSLRSF